jgi:phosphinothricin acetyltransferase
MAGMSSAVIRLATRDDIRAITAIYSDAVLTGTATFELDPPDEDEMLRRMEALARDSYPYFVAERDGQVVGYAYAAAYRPRIGYRHTVEDSVYLAPAAQRQGIGGALLRRLITTCEVAGFRQMVGVIGDSGNVASIRLHALAGFEMVGNLKNVGYKFGRWLDTVFMQRALGLGAREHPTR